MMDSMKYSRTLGNSIEESLLVKNKKRILFLGMFAGFGYEIFIMGQGFFAFLIAADLIFVLAITERARFLEWKPLVWLGNLSLYIYLVHQYIGYTIEYYLTKFFGGYNIVIPIIAVSSAILLAIVIRWISKNIILMINVAFGERKK